MLEPIKMWFYFKRVFTDIVHYELLNMNWTVRYFLNEFHNRLNNVFHVQRGQKLELVPMQTIGNIDNTEYSPALVPSDQTLYDAFYHNNVFGFYVRLVPEPIIRIEEERFTCVICMEMSNHPPIQFYQCTHSEVCIQCIRQCFRSGITQCSICRADYD